MKKVVFRVILILGSLSILLILYLVGDLISFWNRIHVKDEFYIEYLEMYASVSLWNGKQGFVGELREAYWNKDSLVVSGDKGCFLIEFGRTKYNDEMVQIECFHLDQVIKNGSIYKYIKLE